MTSGRYPGRKEEQWWLVLGDPKANTLLAIKRVKLGKAASATLEFTAPAQPGAAKLMLYFMCDSYMGADQEYEVRYALEPYSSKPSSLPHSASCDGWIQLRHWRTQEKSHP